MRVEQGFGTREEETSGREIGKCFDKPSILSRLRGTMAKKQAPEQQIVRREVIERRIYLIREHKVMLDSDLAVL